MFFMYLVAGTVVVLLLCVALAVFKQKEIKLDVISRETSKDKEFFALRIERDDFLFMKNEKAVTFIESLEDVEDYQVMSLADKSESGLSEDSGKLVMPSDGKEAS